MSSACLAARRCRGREWRAQQQAMPVIGFLNPPPWGQPQSRRGVCAEPQPQRLCRGKELSDRISLGEWEIRPTACTRRRTHQRRWPSIAAAAPVAALAAQKATMSIPIVFGLGSDPVKDGLSPASVSQVPTLRVRRFSRTCSRRSGWACCTGSFLTARSSLRC